MKRYVHHISFAQKIVTKYGQTSAVRHSVGQSYLSFKIILFPIISKPPRTIFLAGIRSTTVLTIPHAKPGLHEYQSQWHSTSSNQRCDEA